MRNLILFFVAISFLSCAAAGKTGAKRPLFQAHYERAWLTDVSWSLWVFEDGRIEMQRVRDDRQPIRKRLRTLSMAEIDGLVAAFSRSDLPSLPRVFPSGVADAPEVSLHARVGEDWVEIVAEAPWDQSCTSGFERFAAAWNALLSIAGDTLKCGGDQCQLCGKRSPQ